MDSENNENTLSHRSRSFSGRQEGSSLKKKYRINSVHVLKRYIYNIYIAVLPVMRADFVVSCHSIIFEHVQMR